MNVLLSSIGSSKLVETLQRLHEVSCEKRHKVVQNAATADLIVLCGLWNLDPSALTSHPLVVSHPTKCAVFSEDDIYLPLLRGVYCSPHKGLSSKWGRVRSFSYISRHAGNGNPHVRPLPRDKDLLFSFQGASTCFVRKKLFRCRWPRPDILIEDTSAYWNWDHSADRSDAHRCYAETIARSHFVLCPRGAGTGSHRLFEVMSMGVAPVLIADDYPLPIGPDWNSFLIRVPERQVQHLPRILEGHLGESDSRGRRAREEWLKWFSAEQEFDHLVDACQAALCSDSSKLFRRLGPLMILRHRTARYTRRKLRMLVLKTFEALDVPFPFALRGHDK